jgi:TolC family type I secretion outer membrane protein
VTLSRPIPSLGGALVLAASLLAPSAAAALSLPEAIVLAKQANPDLARADAGAEAARARLAQAQAGRLPTLTLSGESGQGKADLGGFFGFGRDDVSPRVAALELRQPLFTGGAVSAAVTRAREGREAALAELGGARAMLLVHTSEAYVGVLSAGELLALHQAHLRQMQEAVRQADLRFKGGETARTDLAQAQARLAEARAGLARATGQLAQARAHFVSVVGAEPDGLEPLPPPPPTPDSLDEALAAAMETSPALQSARANARAAQAGLRFAQAERLPSLALSATAVSARDQFFPGYRSEGVTVAVQGRWTLFAGGAINGRVAEARAGARGARSGEDAAESAVREAVIGAWSEVETTRALTAAADDQATAATAALDSVRNEVRVGQKPTLDLLDAEREALAARSAVIAARGGAVTAAYRLKALLGGE